MATTERQRRDAAPKRHALRRNSPSLRIRAARRFDHEARSDDAKYATAFAQWHSAEILGALSVHLITKPGGEPPCAWVRSAGAERAPWHAPPASGDPVVFGRCAERTSCRAPGPPGSPVVMIGDEPVGVDDPEQECAMRPCAGSTDGMMDGEIRVDGRASVVRLDGGSHPDNHSP